MFARFFDFAGSDEIANFFADCRVRNIKFAHDVLIQDSIIIVVLYIAENCGSVNISESQFKCSFQFSINNFLSHLFYSLLKYLSKK